MILPPATLGMLGGGQLGRFFVSAAHEMGYKVWVLDPDPHSPAGLIADRHLVAAYDDYVALDTLGSECAAVTTEFENVPADTLDYLDQVHPGASGGERGRGVPEPHRREDLPRRPRPAARPLRGHPQRGRRAQRQRRPVPGHPQGGALRLRRQGPGPRRRPRRGGGRLPALQGRALRAGEDAGAGLRSVGGAGARRGGQCALPSRPARTVTATASSTSPSRRRGRRPVSRDNCAGDRRAHRRQARLRRHAGRGVLRLPRRAGWSTRWRRARTTAATTPSTPATSASTNSR